MKIEHSNYHEGGTTFSPGQLGSDGQPFILVKRREDVTPATEEEPETTEEVWEMYSGRNDDTDFAGQAAWLRAVAEKLGERADALDPPVES